MTSNINFGETIIRRNNAAKLYMVLDCETATLPFANDIAKNENQKKNIAIAKPLIYDLAWQVIDKHGNVYSRHSFLIQETFFVPSVFATAYYREKRPLYMAKYEAGTIECKPWREVMKVFESDLEKVDEIGAYNSMFDFKKALPFTNLYINKLYSNNYQEWEDAQKVQCKAIARGERKDTAAEFDGENYKHNGVNYPLFDIWGLACNHLLNNRNYKRECLENGQVSATGLYFKTSAETAYRYIKQDMGFVEAHTALEDVLIETEILLRIFKKKQKMQKGIIYFPFKALGETLEFLQDECGKGNIGSQHFDSVLNIMESYLENYNGKSQGYYNRIEGAKETVTELRWKHSIR